MTKKQRDMLVRILVTAGMLVLWELLPLEALPWGGVWRLAGYLAAMAVTASVVVQYAAAAAGFLLGILAAIGYDRRLRNKGGLSFTIVRLF